ncbi:hypothetical protein K490DRAFT_61696 [Saccharata proteae CBS 121410]|uniref:Rhodopsin domain-containing protein n=1 Tax=Saccharata proteae CBS 121410 TaxID=1314787 RepID=A0A9P4HZP3_9PEZI|nr:hypothetical protein K490DRAFT_61696 [Saccharata proteae CBS 121410]
MEDRGQQVLAIAITFFVLTWIVVLLRVYVRAILLKSFGSDDWVMVLALLSFTAYLICQIGGVIHGTGQLDKDLSAADKESALRYWYFCELFYAISSASLKVAIGLFLLRIAVRRSHVIIIQMINVSSVLFSFAYLCVFAFQCTPIQTFWTIKPNNPHCFPRDTVSSFTYAASALASVADWTFGTLPAFIVWDLQMNTRTKFVVVGILGFAAIGSTATLVRIPSIKGLRATHDFLYTSSDIAIWSTIEPGIGITAACIATLRPLLKHLLYRTGLSSDERTNTNPWPSNGQTRTGYVRSLSLSHNLNHLRPDVDSGTTTTITGRGDKNWHDETDADSEEHIFTGAGDTNLRNLYVSKSVKVTRV